jgi:diadenosine tetraphosphate (Ap4A) HIT family hydrolase
MNERLPDMTQSEMWLDVSELQEKMKKKIQQTSNFD